jgi:hypothetical protein
LASEENDPEVLYNFLKYSNDPDGFMQTLDETQQSILRRHLDRNMILIQDRINKELDAAIAEIPAMNRKVSSYIKLIVSDWPLTGIKSPEKITSCILTIWDPSEELIDKFKEGISFSKV